MQLQPLDIWQKYQKTNKQLNHIKGYTVSSTNSVVKTEWHHVNEWNSVPIYYPAQNQLQMDQKNLIWTMKCTNCPKKAINMGKTFWTEPDSLRFYEQQIKNRMLETWNFFFVVVQERKTFCQNKRKSPEWAKIFVSYITDRGLILRIHKKLVWGVKEMNNPIK